MNLRDFQIIASSKSIYTGGIDGKWGPKSSAAVDQVLSKNPETKSWSQTRKIIAAIQVMLNDGGYEAGKVDGYSGHNTEEAYNAFLYEKQHGSKEEVPQTVVRPSSNEKFPPQSRVSSFYGQPGPEIQRQLVKVPLPYQMRIDWNLRQRVSSMTLHEKCADSARAALEDILKHYGEAKLNSLGLDRFAGSYNHRKMRGGSSWSMHAYGCAIDFYAQPNGLRTRCPQALFCGEEYKAFFDIWEAHGWTSLGRAIGRDWMHVQAASL